MFIIKFEIKIRSFRKTDFFYLKGLRHFKADIEDIHITVRNALERLINDFFIQRCPSPQDADKLAPTLTIKKQHLYRYIYIIFFLLQLL